MMYDQHNLVCSRTHHKNYVRLHKEFYAIKTDILRSITPYSERSLNQVTEMLVNWTINMTMKHIL